jgi:hypothetical protein
MIANLKNWLEKKYPLPKIIELEPSKPPKPPEEITFTVQCEVCWRDFSSKPLKVGGIKNFSETYKTNDKYDPYITRTWSKLRVLLRCTYCDGTYWYGVEPPSSLLPTPPKIKVIGKKRPEWVQWLIDIL